jgi:Vault protein inter-alpha-trypsin domain
MIRPITATQMTGADPLSQAGFEAGLRRDDGVPLPLHSERIRIVLRGGLALVSREQRFRNDETHTIEVTLTFPMPVHAALCRLMAEIEGRNLTAKAFPRAQARGRYEEAVDDRKTAVLHEEIARGVHMLSVAHVPPGAEVKVTHAWMGAVSPHTETSAMLRIPVTVADIYGSSPFTDADDLAVSSNIIREADVEIDAGDLRATIAGVSPVSGKAKLRLDAPIDVTVEGDIRAAVHGVSADGRRLTVSVLPDRGSDAQLEAALLIDRSGSMGGGVASTNRQAGSAPSTKHAAIMTGLADAARGLRRMDRAELWQFDDICEKVAGVEIPLAEAIGRLEEPRGGTEIGEALRAVITASGMRDILLVTDGLSHALDVQALANSGRRFTIVLIGEDSLEANVGHLAALTGGQILLAAGAVDAGACVNRAIASLRRRRSPFRLETWPLEHAVQYAGGAMIEARWEASPTEPDDVTFAHAVGAFAAAIALPKLREEEATSVAAAHGLVCHLTSLMLVDEAGATQPGLPSQRKVPLMAGSVFFEDIHDIISDKLQAYAAPAPASSAQRPATSMRGRPAVVVQRSLMARQLPSLAGMANRIDWGADPETLRRGDMSVLAPELARLIVGASEVFEIRDLCRPTDNAVALVIGLMAKSIGGSHRAAARLARLLLKGLNEKDIAKAMAAIGL